MDYLYSLLAQLSPLLAILLLVLITAVVFLWKALRDERLEAKAEREKLNERMDKLVENNANEIKELNRLHSSEKKEMNDYMLKQDDKTQDALNSIKIVLESLKVYLVENKK